MVIWWFEVPPDAKVSGSVAEVVLIASVATGFEESRVEGSPGSP